MKTNTSLYKPPSLQTFTNNLKPSFIIRLIFNQSKTISLTPSFSNIDTNSKTNSSKRKRLTEHSQIFENGPISQCQPNNGPLNSTFESQVLNLTRKVSKKSPNKTQFSLVFTNLHLNFLKFTCFQSKTKKFEKHFFAQKWKTLMILILKTTKTTLLMCDWETTKNIKTKVQHS